MTTTTDLTVIVFLGFNDYKWETWDEDGSQACDGIIIWAIEIATAAHNDNCSDIFVGL